jgi:hypothetical protein
LTMENANHPPPVQQNQWRHHGLTGLALAIGVLLPESNTFSSNLKRMRRYTPRWV